LLHPVVINPRGLVGEEAKAHECGTYEYHLHILQLKLDEAAVAAKGFIAKESLLGSGLRFEGEKYFVLQADDERIMGKFGSKGFFIFKSGQGKFTFKTTSFHSSCDHINLRGRRAAGTMQ
jgi:hypothetical protein